MVFICLPLRTSLSMLNPFSVSITGVCLEYDQKEDNKWEKKNFGSFFHTLFSLSLYSDTSKAPIHIMNFLIDFKHLPRCQGKLLATCSLNSLLFSNFCRLSYGHKMCLGLHSSRSCIDTMPRKWASADLKNASSEATHQFVDAILFW